MSQKINLSVALDLLPDAVIWFDEEANLVEVNDTALKMWGYTRDEVKGMTVFDVNPTMSKEIWPKHWKEKVETSKVFESKHQRKNGEIFPVEIMDHFISIDNQKLSCAIIRDITERKKQESKAP